MIETLYIYYNEKGQVVYNSTTPISPENFSYFASIILPFNYSGFNSMDDALNFMFNETPVQSELVKNTKDLINGKKRN